MTCEKHTVSVQTDSSGDATEYSPSVNGRLVSIQYTKDDDAPFSDGVGFTITNASSGETLWEQAAVNDADQVFPKRPNDGTDGTQLTGQYDYCYLANERVKFVIADGGSTKVGEFTIVVER